MDNSLKPVDPKTINWDQLSFTLTPTAFMYIANCKDQWQRGKLQAFGNISISPAACVLNYGQGLFEGMKAYRAYDGNKILLFRPDANAKRIAQGCHRLCIPVIPQEIFMEGVLEVVKANRDYIPPYKQGAPSQGALYIRPVIWGTGPMLGVAPAPSYTFVIYTSPVGPYFKGGLQPIKLMTCDTYHRATPGGTGGIKAIGNYAASMLPARTAKKDGYSEVIFLDAKENRYVEEVGAANFFCITGDTLLTPRLDGAILPGITRQSIIDLARGKFQLKVEETNLSIDDVIVADEAFASGTAAVVSPIGSIFYKQREYQYQDGQVGEKTLKIYEAIVKIQHGIEEGPQGWVYEVK